MRPDQLDRFLKSAELTALTPKTITDPQLLRQEIDEVQRSGIAFDDGEFDPEVRCASMPVHDFTGQVAGAIGISGPVWRLSLQALQSRLEHVKEAAVRLSVEFGAPTAEAP